MKRVLFVDHAEIPGGAQLVIADHIAHLDRDRFTPLVACTPTIPLLAERYRAAGAAVHFIPMARLKVRSPKAIARLIRSARALRRLVRAESVDLVVANTSRAAYVSVLALAGTGVPLVWWVRDFLFHRRLFRLCRRIPRRIICVSRAIKEFYEEDEDPRYAVVYVGNSIYRKIDEVTEDAVSRERARWGIEPGDVVVGFIGRIVADKGPQDVLEACRRLLAEFPRLKCLLVGTGSGQEGDIEGSLRQRIEAEGLGGSVVMTGFQPDESLYYSLLDVYVLSTRTPEPYATGVVQAMMAGRPVIGTATGGTPEIVKDDVTGLLVPPGDPGAMAEAIRKLLIDPARRDRIAAAGRTFALEGNREEVTTAQVEEIYEAVA